MSKAEEAMKIVSIVLAAASCWIHSATAYTCEHDSYPFGTYTALFVPCDVVFYQSSRSDDTVETSDWGYGCDSMDASAVRLETRPILITFFPDQCVGDEERCYTLENKMMSFNESLHKILPPEGTTHVIVNCTEDNIAANNAVDQLVGNLTDMADQFADVAVDLANAMVVAFWVINVAIVASILACIYCCCYGCNGQNGTRRVEHVPMATAYQEVEMPRGKFT